MPNPFIPLLRWLRWPAKPEIDKDMSMEPFEIIYPRPNDSVTYCQYVIILGVPKKYTPQVYILSNDSLWHRQERPTVWDAENGHWFALCYFGEELNRSGWRYVITAILSTEALPHTMDVLPELPGGHITTTIPVIRW